MAGGVQGAKVPGKARGFGGPPGPPIIIHFFTNFNISGLVFGVTSYTKASIDLSRKEGLRWPRDKSM